MGEYLRGIAPDATIRYGDYPYEKGLIDVTLVLSGLKEVDRVTAYLTRTAS
ncbi:hypothetical protein DGWBC_0316 [Dehalogenimonas sp. WBC-2]|nr:hypothetical protein DGWBC_0316 [Dehalogenimonas sp. WBC-2]